MDYQERDMQGRCMHLWNLDQLECRTLFAFGVPIVSEIHGVASAAVAASPSGPQLKVTGMALRN